MAEPVDMNQLRKDVGEAIAAAISRHEVSVTVKWLALVETIDGDGQRGLWPLGSDGIQSWDAMGMLGHAYAMEQADVIADRLARDT